MARLPNPGGDQGQWGQILNDYLSQAHTASGVIKPGSIAESQLTTSVQASLTRADTSVQTVNSQAPVNGNVALTSAHIGAVPLSQKGAANGVADLDSNGKLPEARMPSATAPIGTYVSGRSYMTAGYWTNTGAAMAEGDMVGTPFILSAQQRFDQIETRLFGVSSAGGLMRLGIYADNNEEPGSLIVDAGVVDASLTVGTLLTRTIDLLLSPGIYWVVQVPQGGATTRGAPFGARGAIGETPGIWARRPNDANYCYPMRTGVTGALPSSFDRTTEHHTGHRATLRSSGAI